MPDLDPAAIMAKHPRSEHVGGMSGRPFCGGEEHVISTYWPCQTYLLAADLAEANRKLAAGNET